MKNQELSSPEQYLQTFPLPKGWRVEKDKKKGLALVTEEGLIFCLDFSSTKALSPKQPLAKAIGLKGKKLTVLDITAGWAKEAFLMAQSGCHVTAVESNPFIFHFVQESLSQKKKKKLPLHFILDNSLNYLKNIKEAGKPDVIYMDPMFGEKKKSLSQKALKILKKIAGETKDKEELFFWSLKTAKKRVVVKRHHLESSLKGHRLCVFEGRSVCYDVFMPKGR